MQRSMFFNSSSGDRVYKAEDWADYFSTFIGNGVFPNPSSGLQVMALTGMEVTVKMGKAWINGYFLNNTTDNNMFLGFADGSLKRIDRIVARWSLGDRSITIQLKKGTFAANPIAPPLQRDADVFELGIADIFVGAGVTTITQANITDLRLNKTYCGIVAGTVEEVDTTTIFNQYQAWFNTFTFEETAAFEAWFATIQDILDENVAAQLLAMIETKQAAITAVGLLKGEGDGAVVAAVAGTDYVIPSALNAKQNTITANGMLKGNGDGTVIAAVAGTDYVVPSALNGKQATIMATGLLKGSGNGTVIAAVANTDYATPSYVNTQATNAANSAINSKIIVSTTQPAVSNGALWIKY